MWVKFWDPSFSRQQYYFNKRLSGPIDLEMANTLPGVSVFILANRSRLSLLWTVRREIVLVVYLEIKYGIHQHLLLTQSRLQITPSENLRWEHQSTVESIIVDVKKVNVLLASSRKEKSKWGAMTISWESFILLLLFHLLDKHTLIKIDLLPCCRNLLN